MLNKDTGGSSAAIELVIGLVLILGVGFGVYSVQHPPLTPQQQMSAALQQ